MTPRHDDHVELAALLSAWVDGSLDDAGQSRMEQLMRDTSPGCGADFATMWLDQHATLAAALIAPAQAKPAPSEAKCRIAQTQRLRITPIALSLAAALLLTAAAVFAVYLIAVSRSPSPVRFDRAPIATLIDSTGSVIAGDDIAHPGSDVPPGEYSIDSGTAQFLLTNRVTVDLYGRTRLAMHGNMSATLLRGSASFVCPPEANGFTVYLPGESRVIDRGTAFHVHIDDADRCTVYVSEGVVEIVSPDGAAQRATADSGYRITADQLVEPVSEDEVVAAFGPAVLARNDREAALLTERPLACFVWSSRDGDGLIDLATRGRLPLGGDEAGDLGLRPDLMLDHPMTVETLFRFEASTVIQRLITVGTHAKNGSRGWGIGVAHDEGVNVPFFTHYGVGDYWFTQAPLESGRSYHLAVRVDADDVTLLVGGQPVQTIRRKGPMLRGDADAVFGNNVERDQRVLGPIKYIAVYGRLLSAETLRARSEL